MTDQGKKLVLVVGAGASYEVGLPTGHLLKEEISNLLDIKFENGYDQSSGDTIICDAFKEAVRCGLLQGNSINSILGEAWAVRDAMPQAISIDNYIDSHQGDKKIELCGKLAIARAILAAERNSHVYVRRIQPPEQINFRNLENSWLNPFFRVITQNCKASDLIERFRKISLIVFNYDRCIEQYLYSAVQNYYRVDQVTAAEIVGNIEIFHPYGKVGHLEWQQRQEAMPFGTSVSGRDLLNISEKIKTFTEGTNPDSSEIIAIRNSLAMAEKVLFLGFAFHPLNMSLIRPDSMPVFDPNKKQVYATAYGISNADSEEISVEIKKVMKCISKNVFVRNDLTCSKIFTEYSRGLSLL